MSHMMIIPFMGMILVLVMTFLFLVLATITATTITAIRSTTLMIMMMMFIPVNNNREDDANLYVLQGCRSTCNVTSAVRCNSSTYQVTSLWGRKRSGHCIGAVRRDAG